MCLRTHYLLKPPRLRPYPIGDCEIAQMMLNIAPSTVVHSGMLLLPHTIYPSGHEIKILALNGDTEQFRQDMDQVLARTFLSSLHITYSYFVDLQFVLFQFIPLQFRDVLFTFEATYCKRATLQRAT